MFPSSGKSEDFAISDLETVVVVVDVVVVVVAVVEVVEVVVKVVVGAAFIVVVALSGVFSRMTAIEAFGKVKKCKFLQKSKAEMKQIVYRS